MISIALFLLFGALFPGRQQPAEREPPSVDRMWGKLLHVSRVPISGSPSQFQEKEKTLKNVVLQLYRRSGDSKCCGGLSPVAETTTGRWGHFHFRRVASGKYWLIAHLDGRDYTMAVRFEYNKASSNLCSDFVYMVADDGEFWSGHNVTVD